MLLLAGALPLRLTAQSAKYHADKHTLTVSLQNTPVSGFIEALSREGFQLYIVDLDKDFTVSGTFSNAPADDVLEKIIPKTYHYFYRVNEQGEKTMFESAGISGAPKPMLNQSGDKLAAKPAVKATLGDVTRLQNLPNNKFRIQPASGNADAVIGAQKPKLPGRGAMAAAENVKPGAPVKSNVQEEAEMHGPPARVTDEHLVVTFKVTKTGIEPVRAAYEAGAYIPQDENTARKDYALIGIENNAVVLLESVENPLEARSIFDPSNKSDHGSFPQDEGYITVRMPKKYDNAAASGRLKLQLGKLEDAKRGDIFKKFRAKQLKSADLTTSLQVVRSAQSLNLSKITIAKRQ